MDISMMDCAEQEHLYKESNLEVVVPGTSEMLKSNLHWWLTGRQMQFQFLYIPLFPALVKGQTSRQEDYQESEVNMYRHAGALICMEDTWVLLQMETPLLQRVISPRFFSATLTIIARKKTSLNVKFLEHCSVSTEWIFNTIFSVLLAELECK